MIYMILYSKELFTGVFNTRADDVYYTDKNKVIKRLEDEGYRFVHDDTFLRDNHTIAEIIGLEEAV
ncbi:TPA: hypothetical protein RED31_001310 [Staphylococcus pseudintermedius]|nr:hypothetical protein [Staphylococcus pseudintermedius]